jgi:anthranilate phosphoribosyltransferase
MTSPLHLALGKLAAGRTLTAEETAAAFGVVMRGEATPALIAALLLGLRARGETAEEIAGAAQALREAMVAVPQGDGGAVIDTCGTGGGTVGTFNLSTAAAFVAAGAGARVAKHGNRSYTSKCGSADVLEALGVDITLPVEAAALRLRLAGMVFLFAPNYHPAMRHVGPTRKELGVATIMNLLGPLANPAGVRRQVIGVADRAKAPLMAEALARLGAEHALVVHGEVGMDEISPSGMTEVWEVRHGEVAHWILDPKRHGLAWDGVADLAGGEPAANAARIERLLTDGAEDEAGRRAVLLNAGAAIYVSGLADRLDDAFAMAREALESGRGHAVLQALRGAGD